MVITCDRPMMTEAPVMKPQMTEWERKLVIQPSRRRPTAVYRHPASRATCRIKNPIACSAAKLQSHCILSSSTYRIKLQETIHKQYGLSIAQRPEL